MKKGAKKVDSKRSAKRLHLLAVEEDQLRENVAKEDNRERVSMLEAQLEVPYAVELLQDDHLMTTPIPEHTKLMTVEDKGEVSDGQGGESNDDKIFLDTDGQRNLGVES